jgi:hypothetical protein
MADSRPHLNLVFIGHIDAGKSTLEEVQPRGSLASFSVSSGVDPLLMQRVPARPRPRIFRRHAQIVHVADVIESSCQVFEKPEFV